MEILIKQIAGGADTAAQGEIVLRSLIDALKQGGQVVVNFDGDYRNVVVHKRSFCAAAY